jgi:endonuclease/exonuclease/phosphatase family metal-dependent hydrolase
MYELYQEVNKQMKKILYLTLVSFVVIVGVSIPSQSNLAIQNVELPVQDIQLQSSEESSLAITSFNIQFLGQSTRRDDAALAMILRDYDIVVVQELVAPPYEGNFPDGSEFKPDMEAAEFFNAMTALGFEYQLSTEDTGTRPSNHNNGTGTEWWVVFYKSDKVEIANGLPTEFLADDRTDNDNYERVPHAFAFKTPNNELDFVLISVHLKPGGGSSDMARRKSELDAIADWVDDHDNQEKDFIILGDMNIEDCDELKDATPAGFVSLNDECEATNTNVNGPKPYDHVLIRQRFTREIDEKFDFRVFNLIEAMRPFWNSPDPYPGGSINPIGFPEYDHNSFRAFYSDHHPVVFKLNLPAEDDD